MRAAALAAGDLHGVSGHAARGRRDTTCKSTMDEMLLSEAAKGRVGQSAPTRPCSHGHWSRSGNAYHGNVVAGCRAQAAAVAHITESRWPAAEDSPGCNRRGRGSGTEMTHLTGM